MQQLKLLQLLRSLNRRERKQFDRYMQSPFFYKRRECVVLYAYLQAFAPNYDDVKLQREAVFAAVFVGETYTPHRILRTASELTRDLENCLAHLQMQQNEALRREALANHYFDTHNFDYLAATLNEWTTQTAQTTERSVDYYAQQAAILDFRRKSNDTKAEHSAAANTLDETLDIIFIAQKLHLSCQKISNAQVFNQTLETAFLQPILDYIAQKPAILAIPLVQLYYLPLQLLSQNEAVSFEAFLAFLHKNAPVLAQEDLRNAYLLAENICAIQLRRGNQNYWQLVYDLYQQEISNGMLYNPDGSVRMAVFKNVVTVGLRLAQFDWTLRFLQTHRDRLPAAEREDVYQYNLANVHFFQRNYEKTLDLLNTIHYTDTFYKLAARVLRLKTYYMLQTAQPFYADLLESELAAFKVFIYRLTELAKSHRLQYRNFMLFLEKITKLSPKDTKKRAALHQKITDTPEVAEKTWLLGI
jgi:hypothetical protein